MTRRRTTMTPSVFSVGVVGRLLITLAMVVLAVLLVLLAASGFLTYRVLSARNDVENITPAVYLLSNYEPVSFTDHRGGEHEGWLLLGLKNAPVIFLCHGYNSNRSELLPLGMLLRDNHFNVFLFNFQGPKVGRRFSDLGVRETGDLQAAIAAVAKRRGVNPQRVGVYGVGPGGYAALAVAQRNPLVKALVMETIYDNPDQMLDFQLDQLLGGAGGLFHFLARTEFHLFRSGGQPPAVRDELAKLAGVPKLFISAREAAGPAAITESLYSQSPPPRRLLVFEHSQSGSASNEEKREHKNQIVEFFLKELPLRGN